LLRDALGRLNAEIEVKTGQAVVPIPLAGQLPGLYLVQVLTGNDAPVTLRLIKE